jgi:hypothetical protein
MNANVKPRSPSIESDGSSELGGFWEKSPNSDDESSSDDSADEESINWSPASSPNREVLEGSFLHDSRSSYNPFDQARRKSLNFNEDSMTVGMGLDGLMGRMSRVPPRTASKVSFAEPMHNQSLDDATDPLFRHSKSDVGGETHEIHTTNQSYMRRSRSYSALSSAASENLKFEEEKKPAAKRPSFDQDQYREYYLKFVDLVIARETTAAAHTKS